MRKAEKEQIISLLKLMEQAHWEICLNIEKKNYSNVIRLLEDCQQVAITVGRYIEKVETEDLATILMLEDYCEQVYQIHEIIVKQEVVSAAKIKKNLKKQFVKILNSVKNDIKVRKEIVFLPYKASMWDSLESLWRAVDADPECNARVIPIPYFDKGVDGSLKEMHYEGASFPNDVPITYYKDWDLSTIRPDMIFIHNPYDECNYITSVHPDFYSKKLREFTECLVYVPYFVLNEIDSCDIDAIGRVEHYVTLPGVIYADKVIVQSEAMKSIYVEIMSKYAGEQTKKMWKEKILGLGSPKFDKLVRTAKDSIQLPADWGDYIGDKNSKKIILYNTSVNSLLNHSNAYIEKMRAVFRLFNEHADVLLLWRPHPLIEATISSMRPELWREYQLLVKEYKENKWGIYDDTPDIDRAIRISDAYYGDCSSVVQLCQSVGMPIMIQSIR
ncbi:MAG: hypothetical protein Q4D94_10565 [Bacillota bacterium]|nr:hypothetical protein [Bacillota bacterium]